MQPDDSFRNTFTINIQDVESELLRNHQDFDKDDIETPPSELNIQVEANRLNPREQEIAGNYKRTFYMNNRYGHFVCGTIMFGAEI